MRRLVTFALVTAVAVGALGIVGIIHHLSGARFQATTMAEPPMTVSGCTAFLHAMPYGFSTDAASPMCRFGARAGWFKVTVRNTGRRGAYLKGCDLTGLDASGAVVFRGVVSVGPLSFPAGPYLGPGQSLTWRWFLVSSPTGAYNTPLAPKAPAARYEVSCEPIDYHGLVPA